MIIDQCSQLIASGSCCVVCMDESFQMYPGGERGAAWQQETPAWPLLLIQLKEGGADPEQQNLIMKHLQGKTLRALLLHFMSASNPTSCARVTLFLFMQH